eukprot:8176946-Pyramimonas_sp.AAC.1
MVRPLAVNHKRGGTKPYGGTFTNPSSASWAAVILAHKRRDASSGNGMRCREPSDPSKDQPKSESMRHDKANSKLAFFFLLLHWHFSAIPSFCNTRTCIDSHSQTIQYPGYAPPQGDGAGHYMDTVDK